MIHRATIGRGQFLDAADYYSIKQAGHRHPFAHYEGETGASPRDSDQRGANQTFSMR